MTRVASSNGGTILVVCTGNLCRSPYMAAALTSLVQANGRNDVAVESAGTSALVGAPIATMMQDIMGEEGLATAGTARQLDHDMLTRADLILTASREHRSTVVKLRPAALRRTFTLRQAARLLAAAPVSAKDGLVPVRRVAQVCADRRGQLGPSAGDDDDVADPWNGPASDYSASVDSMRASLGIVADALIGPGCWTRSTGDR